MRLFSVGLWRFPSKWVWLGTTSQCFIFILLYYGVFQQYYPDEID